MIVTAATIIGTSTFLFHGALQASTAAEFEKTNIIPTTYMDASATGQILENRLPTGYKKGNYTIGAIDLEYYASQDPTSTDIAKEDAAEVGAQALWEIFNVNLDGQLIEMGYQQATESFPRSSWYADVVMNDERSFYFSVDSVTGELLDIGRASRTLKENVSVAFDPVLDKNPEEFETLVKELAEKYNVVHSAVESVEYNGQGYSNNDPTISVDVFGENGEIALMTLSRYDKELLGIGYPASYKLTLDYHEQLLEKLKEHEESAPPSDENETPFLKTLDLE